ncbi:hypothetical protein [Paenibacillus rigui]|uniref:Uncharacterized protein n=1 Tax=Paenibacillus rigui TaxID=554312 RepID=A0A229UVH0_9BACL|nr:hypothetical protein [Paenibacillus rigui]OXM87135.1 hypothetical protein CF651_05635 [Paenibacillus rigui]
MRTENQIKRKLNELQMQKQTLASRKAELQSQAAQDDNAIQSITLQVEHVEDMILLLEWVLNAPMGSYHG